MLTCLTICYTFKAEHARGKKIQPVQQFDINIAGNLSKYEVGSCCEDFSCFLFIIQLLKESSKENVETNLKFLK